MIPVAHGGEKLPDHSEFLETQVHDGKHGKGHPKHGGRGAPIQSSMRRVERKARDPSKPTRGATGGNETNKPSSEMNQTRSVSAMQTQAPISFQPPQIQPPTPKGHAESPISRVVESTHSNNVPPLNQIKKVEQKKTKPTRVSAMNVLQVPPVRLKQWPWLARVHVDKVPKVPDVIPRLSKEARLGQLEKDWSAMQITDLADLATCQAIKDVFYKFYDVLCYVFGMYSVHGSDHHSGRAQYMSLLSFIHLCKTCKIPDSVLRVANLDLLFSRTPGEASSDSQREEQKQEHVFVRAEFMECIVRLAMLKFTNRKDYENLTPPTAVYGMCQEYLMSRAILWKTDTFSQSLVAEDVVEWFSSNTHQLYNLFMSFASKDKLQFYTMALSEYHNFLERFEIVGSSLSKQSATDLFTRALESEETDLSTPHTSNSRMAYIEFAELVAIIANKMGAPDHSLRQKLESLGSTLFA